ncbi:MAG: Rpn family recombination-promoting nuclease/putative transposase [Fibrobacter sp.]|nr:Rpn family recombination-promoting nuclease/putative transposase [Fibrobacter sp.]
MKRKRLQSPHDRFLKVMFSKTAVVSSFINSCLFPNIEIDYNLSSAIKNDTVDGFLNEFRSDIVYRLFDKTNARFIYLLFEHKSTPDKKTLVQIKHYLNSIENDIPEGEKHEGPIPVLIYHGRRKWISLCLWILTIQTRFCIQIFRDFNTCFLIFIIPLMRKFMDRLSFV